MKYCSYIRKENKYFACNSPWLYSYVFIIFLLINCWKDRYLNYLPDFYWHSQYHKHSYSCIGWWGATKCWAKATLTLKTAKLHPLVPFSTSHSYHTKQLNPCPMNSSANSVVNYSWLAWPSGAVCLSREDGAILKTIQALMGIMAALRNEPQQKQSGQLSLLIPAWIVS